MGAILVHAQSRGQSAAAHHGNTGHLYQSLNGTVFSVFTVKDRECSVESGKSRAFFSQLYHAVNSSIGNYIRRDTVFLIFMPFVVFYIFSVAVIAKPSAVLSYTYGNDIVFIFVYIGEDRIPGIEGNPVLAGTASVQHCDCFLFHVQAPFLVALG